VSAAATVNADAGPDDACASAVEVAHLRFTYPQPMRTRMRTRRAAPRKRIALDGVSLRIAEGASVALLGPNGSGKSTLLRVLATMLRPDGGTVRVFGRTDRTSIRQSLGVVFQSPGLDAHMTVDENLIDSARLHGMTRSAAEQAIDDTAQHVGIADRRGDRVKTLSGGLARQADLCRALLHQPKLLLLDEPTTGLDPSARERFMQLVARRRAATNLTVLMTTHLTEEAARFDRVVMLHEGRIVASDTPGNLQQRAGAARLIVHDPNWSPPTDDRKWQKHSDHWRLTFAEDAEDVQQLAARLAEQRVPFTLAPPTLADVFEQLTGASLIEHDT